MTSPAVRRGPSRWLWFVAGWASVGIGGIGVVVPGLPTTVFFIVAAWCFARCSPRFEQWVLDLPGVGQMVKDHRAGLGMPRRAKAIALTMMSAVVMVSALLLIENLAVSVAVLLAGAIGAWYIVARVPTRERVIEARGL